jgi:hypothetical protein
MSNYTNLDTLIPTIPDWEILTAEEILAWISEEVTELRSNRKNGAWLLDNLKTDVTCGLANVLKTNGLEFVNQNLATEQGLDFGNPEMQRMLEILKQQNPLFAEHADVLIALGKVTYSRWVKHNGPGDIPSLEQVTERLSLCKLEKMKRENAAWKNDVLDPLVRNAINEGKTLTEIKTLITGALQ